MNDEQRDTLLLDLLVEQRKSSPVMSPFAVGDAVHVRTVTMHYTGRVVSCDGQWLVLDEAAWLPGWSNNPRFADLLANGNPGEVEPYPGRCVLGVGAILDVSPWLHALPRIQK